MTLLVSRQPAEDPPRPLRILIVDDHLLYAEALSLLLREQDLEVVGIAGDGRQGLAAAAELRPDLVLMDIEMPLMDGITATRRIRECLPETRVVVMTALTGEEHAEQALGAGAAAFVRKFSAAGDLLTAIESAV